MIGASTPPSFVAAKPEDFVWLRRMTLCSYQKGIGAVPCLMITYRFFGEL